MNVGNDKKGLTGDAWQFQRKKTAHPALTCTTGRKTNYIFKSTFKFKVLL